MVLFGIGAYILDLLLVKTTSFAAETAISVTLWSVKSLAGTIWKPAPTEEQCLRIEVSKLRYELDRLESSLETTVCFGGGDEYLVI